MSVTGKILNADQINKRIQLSWSRKKKIPRAGRKGEARYHSVYFHGFVNEPNYANPWNMEGSESSRGSGVLIEGNKIMTHAHVVSNQTDLQVRVNGAPDKYEASV